MNKNPNYCEIDLRDEVKIIWTDTGEIVFRGFTHQTLYGGDSAVFLCYGGTRRLHEERITLEVLGMEPQDVLYFIAISGGLKAHFHGGPRPNLSFRDFKVIFPIEGLEIPCDFKVENILFTPNIRNELSDQAKKGKALCNPPWSNASAFAVVILKANHFYEALIEAEKLAQRAIDWIQFRTDITIPCIIEGGKKKRIYYSLRKNFSRFRLIKYGLVTDLTTGASLFYLLDERIGHPLVFKYNPDEFLEPIVPIWNKLAKFSTRKESEVQALYQTLNWLMLSYEEESPIDNLLQLWIAFEFLCSREKVPKFVKRSSLKKAITCIENLNIPQDEKKKIIEKINEVNNPSLMTRWNHLLNRLRIRLTNREKELISKLRSARNKVIHGDKIVELSIEQIEKFRSVLERVFLLKIENI